MRFDPLDFDGFLFEVLDGYKAGKLAAADDVRRRVAASKALGDLLTPDVIAKGTQVLHSIDVGNTVPLFPPLFLTFLENPRWTGPTDHALGRLKRALAARPSRYRGFVRSAAVQPMGGLFELNIYTSLDDTFPPADPQPRLPNGRHADVRIVIEGTSVFVEASVIGEGAFWSNVRRRMHVRGVSVYTTSGPGPADDARRVLAKIAKELRQVAPGSPNVLCLSFFDTFPSSYGRKWAIEDLWAGGSKFGRWKGGSAANLSGVKHLDSLFEFDRDRLTGIHINTKVAPPSRLSRNAREALAAALAGPFMIR